MSIAISIIGIIATIALVCGFWYMIIEAQKQAGKEATYRNAMKSAEKDDRPYVCPTCSNIEAWITWNGEILCDVCTPNNN